MKTRQYALSFALLSIQLIGLAQAQAQAYQETVYTRETVRRCQNQTENTILGGVLGTALGATAGALFGGGRAAPIAIGALTAGAAGALIGNGLSCQDETRYMSRLEEHLSRPDYRTASMYEDDHLRCVILRSGYTPNREICRTYRSEILTPRGWVERDETACYIDGMWRHGYDGVIIAQELWHREPPPPRPAIILIASLRFRPPPPPAHYEVGVAYRYDNHREHREYHEPRRNDRHDDRRDDRHDDRKPDRGGIDGGNTVVSTVGNGDGIRSSRAAH